jgi:hypothetical protein
MRQLNEVDEAKATLCKVETQKVKRHKTDAAKLRNYIKLRLRR